MVHLSQYTTKGFGTNIYNFAYDGANRITAADFSGSGQHNTSYTYDKNGNIESLTREGRHGGSNLYGDIDNLTYTYNGNQLLSVNDVNDPNHQNNGFTDDGSFLNTEYTYDDNGNLLSDLNKNLSISKYNHLNLPEQLNLNPPQHYYEISYLYSAAGQKLHKATHIDFTPATTTDYVGSFIYQEDQLQSILTPDLSGSKQPEGRVVVDGSSYEYQYFLKDHLGNTRITFNESGTIIQEDSYYPYGMNMAGLSHESGVDLPNKFLYNGKELQDDFGLDWYDYEARFYDAVLGRWHVVDQLADSAYSWTPYRYAFNNPLKFIDPDGKIEWPVIGNTAVNKSATKNGGWDLKNTVVRTSTYLDTDRPPGASNPHIGIDYRASEGTTFHSLGDGKVVAMSESTKGGKFITVEYIGGDQVSFRHINNTSDGIKVGSNVYEGQPLGETGKTGTNHPHLHIDAKDSEGNRIDPENKNYGIVTNKEFFEQHNGDWQQLKKVKEAAIIDLNRAGNEFY